VILIIDNYDSFTYNLVQRLGEIGLGNPALRHEIVVIRNDERTLKELADLKPDFLIVSPGPCTPREANISNDAIRHFADRIPVLGVCLGHQCIAHAFGSPVIGAKRIMHGKTSTVHHDGRTIFRNVENPMTAMRYHSLIVPADAIGDDFELTAWTDARECMGLRHRRLPVEGVQFHPESFLTPEGFRILENFLRNENRSSTNAPDSPDPLAI
jgi:para-aminobenzoate synthetase component 2